MKHKNILVLVFALMLVMLPVLSACTDDSTNPPPTTTSPPATESLLPVSDDVAGVDASLVYASYCASCHGTQRQGGVGPNLSRDQSVAYLSQWLPVHRTGVTMDSRLRDLLINWVYTNSTQTSAPAPTDPAVVYAFNCAVCHAADRSGGNGGPSIEQIDLQRQTADFLAVFLKSHYSGVYLTQEQHELLGNWLKSNP